MKKAILIILIIGVVIMTNFSASRIISAQEDRVTSYTLLAPLPDLAEVSGNNFLETYIKKIFSLAIGLSAAAAVLMIVFGGFQYMTSDAVFEKTAGRARIKNAVLGLILVICSWLILNTINPDLLDFNFSVDPAVIDNEPTMVPPGGATGLQPVTILAQRVLMAQCTGCNIVVTSTTGGSHNTNSLHYQGLAVDLAPDDQLNQFLTGNTQNPAPCQVITKTLGDSNARFLWEPTGSTCGGTVASSGDHWHMSVSQ